MTRKKRYSFLPVLAVEFILVVVFTTMFIMAQQLLRMGADDPQIELAQTAAAQLNNEKEPERVVTGRVDIDRSSTPFIILYNKQGEPVKSSGYLDGAYPKIPVGVLHASAGHDYHAVTWQPRHGLRFASVTVAAKDYFVVSGRSLAETERRTATLQTLSLTGLLAASAVVGVVAFIRTKAD